MASLIEHVQAAWRTGDPLAIHREVEQLAAQGHTKERLQAALESLLLEARASGASDETQEIINSVWDRLTGWCHASRHIETKRVELPTEAEIAKLPRQPMTSGRMSSELSSP